MPTETGTRWQAIGPWEAKIHQVFVNPVNPNIVYVRTENGLYKSTNGGDDWKPLKQRSFKGKSITGFVVSPKDAETLYMAISGEGILKSTSGGDFWTESLSHSKITGLVIDPDTSILYAGTSDDGMFKSTDSGANWNKINEGLGTGDDLYIRALAVSPHTADTLYISTLKGNLYKTTDAGQSWHLVIADKKFIGIVVDPNNKILYGYTSPTIDKKDKDVRGIWKSLDGGISWERIEKQPSKLGDYIKMLSIDPSDSNILYLHYTSVAPPFSGMRDTNHLSRSINGGKSWDSLGGFNSGDSNNVSAFALDPLKKDVWYVGTEGGGAIHDSKNTSGMYKSTDQGNSWKQINTGLSNLNVLDIAIDPSTPATLYAASNDLEKSTDGGHSWNYGKKSNKHFLNNVTLDPRSPNILYTCPSKYTDSTDGGALYKNVNSGEEYKWEELGGGCSGKVFIVIEPNSKTFYSGGKKSTDEGKTWQTIWNSSFGTLDSLTLQGSTLYVQTEDDKLYKSANVGSTWTLLKYGKHNKFDIVSKIYHKRFLRILVEDPNNSNIIYIGTSKGVIKSTDGGDSWESAGLGDKEIKSLAIDDDTLYAGTNKDGVFKSTESADGSRDWQAMGLDGEGSINILAIDSNSTPYAAVKGKGLFIFGGSAVVAKPKIPTITSINPTSSTINELTTFTINGTGLRDGMGFAIENCAPVFDGTTGSHELPGGTDTQRQFRCTPQGSTGKKTGVIKTAPGGKVLYTFIVKVTHSVSSLYKLPRITSVSPTVANLGEATTFTVTGRNLKTGMGFAVNDCVHSSQELPGGTDTQRQFHCTPLGKPDTKGGLVKDEPGGNVLYYFRVQVSDPNKLQPKVSSVSPLITTLKGLTLFTVKGVNLFEGMGFTVAECEHSNDELPGGTSTQRQFQCTQYGSLGSKRGLVKDAPGGQILYEFTVEAGTVEAGIVETGAEFCAAVTEIPQAECEYLVALYNSTDGPNWINNNGWNVTNSPCSWYGVSCYEGHFTHISLESNKLKGSIPDWSALTNLQSIALYDNQLSGPIPDWTALTNLHFISMFDNQLSGPIPDLSALTNLGIILLDVNQLSGPIPDLSALTSLEHISMGNNQLSGDIPLSLSTLPNLSILLLNNNCLTASDPTLVAFLDSKDPEWATTQNCSLTTPIIITNVTPLTSSINEVVIFTVTGTNLTDGMGFTVADCEHSNDELSGGTSTQRQFQCTQYGSIGSKRGLVKDAPGGQILYEFTVEDSEVSDPNKRQPKVSSVSPLITTLKGLTIFTVKGVNLFEGMGFTVAECEHSNDELPGGTSTQRQFQCTQYGDAGFKRGLVKDAPGGQILYEFTVEAREKHSIQVGNTTIDYPIIQSVLSAENNGSIGNSTAKFYGGISVNSDDTFEFTKNNVKPYDNITVNGVILPEADHVGKKADIAVIAFHRPDPNNLSCDPTNEPDGSGYYMFTRGNSYNDNYCIWDVDVPAKAEDKYEKETFPYLDENGQLICNRLEDGSVRPIAFQIKILA